MRIISTATSFDGKEIHSVVSLSSGRTLNLFVRRVGPRMSIISPNYEGMVDEVTADEYIELNSLTRAFSYILMRDDWIEER